MLHTRLSLTTLFLLTEGVTVHFGTPAGPLGASSLGRIDCLTHLIDQQVRQTALSAFSLSLLSVKTLDQILIFSLLNFCRIFSYSCSDADHIAVNSYVMLQLWSEC